MSMTHLTLALINAGLDYSEHPDQAALAADFMARLRSLVTDPKYDAILLDAHLSDEDFAMWAAR